MIAVIDKPATNNKLQEILAEFAGYIKIVVDVEREILAGGCQLHVDCEQELLLQGSKQENLWGGGVDLANKQIEFNSLTNIKPKQDNPSQEILDKEIRQKFENIVRRLIPMEVPK